MQKEEEEVSVAICGGTTCQLETYKFCQCGSYITCGFGLQCGLNENTMDVTENFDVKRADPLDRKCDCKEAKLS